MYRQLALQKQQKCSWRLAFMLNFDPILFYFEFRLLENGPHCNFEFCFIFRAVTINALINALKKLTHCVKIINALTALLTIVSLNMLALHTQGNCFSKCIWKPDLFHICLMKRFSKKTWKIDVSGSGKFRKSTFTDLCAPWNRHKSRARWFVLWLLAQLL